MTSRDLYRRVLAPFIYFVRRVRCDAEASTFADQPAMRRLYGLWRAQDGTCTASDGATHMTLRPGGVLLTRPGMQVTVHPHARVVYCAFSLLPRLRLIHDDTITIEVAEPAEPDWTALFGRDLPVLLPAQRGPQARELVDRISATYWRSPAHRQAAGLQLGAWLLTLVAESETPDVGDSLVQRIDDLIAIRAREPVTIADLAHQLGCSEALCRRRYRARRGIAPGEALRQERIAQAQQLLRDNAHITVAEVASKVGYRDANAFNRAFHQVVGLPPGRWQRQQRG